MKAKLMPLWLSPAPLILASKSRIRRDMLEAAGLPVETLPADIDERAIEKESGAAGPAAVALLLATEKARAVSRGRTGRVVLGADQTLALGNKRFSKPANRDAARAQLLEFRGRTHELHSAAVLVRDGAVLSELHSAAKLTMRPFSDEFLERYLDAAGPAMTESVGGYQLERLGVQLFEHIEGDHFTILGLPLVALLHSLRNLKLLSA